MGTQRTDIKQQLFIFFQELIDLYQMLYHYIDSVDWNQKLAFL